MIYGSDLAHVHHTGFGSLAVAAAGVVVRELRAGAFSSGLVVDLGCGTGILAKVIVENGFDALGVDISPAMIAEATIHTPPARFHVASLHEFEIPDCGAVTAVGESVTYLDPGEDAVDLDPLFTRVWKALAPGGLLLFDVIESTRADPMSYRNSRSGPDWEVTTEVSEDMGRSTLTRTITTTRKVDQTMRSTREVHRVQTFYRKDLKRMLTRRGFYVEIGNAYGDTPLAARRICVLARRPRN